MKRMAAAVAALLLVAACSGDDDASNDAATPTIEESTTTTEPEPTGPAADVSEELTGGNGIFVGSPPDRVDDPAYVASEFVAAGTAEALAVEGTLTSDGRWTLTPDRSADYRSRIVVRSPEDPDDFSGVVLLEWMNVSGGIDADPGWSTLQEEIVRQGHIWIGVSAQALGIEGGEVRVSLGEVEGSDAIGKGLRAIDPDRYGSLGHPGDGYSFDIYSQVARAVRVGIPGTDLTPTHVIATGQSQSAYALVTYLNGFQPETDAFDGFFVHSRGATGFPVEVPDAGGSEITDALAGEPTIVRTDLDVPVTVLQAENDLFGPLRSIDARQDDTDQLRLWEVAGTAHADIRLTGETAAASIDCGAPINDGPMHLVAKAAFRGLVTWVENGTAPPEAPRLELTDDGSAIARDADGIALGGIRTPPVEVPTEVLSGEPGPSGEIFCILSGSVLPLPAPAPGERYGSLDGYLRAFDESVDATIDAGFVLDDDRAALEAYATPERLAG